MRGLQAGNVKAFMGMIVVNYQDHMVQYCRVKKSFAFLGLGVPYLAHGLAIK